MTLVQGEATRTMLEDGSVDLAWLANVWHELDNRDATLTEMARVVRPGGRLGILDWRPDVEQPPGPPIAHRVAGADVQASLRARGWEVEDPEPAGRFSYLVLATRATGSPA